MKYCAFAGGLLVASGELAEVAAACVGTGDVLIFDNSTGEVVDLDPRGIVERKPGRPKLGVVAREVTLLPRHWEWLGRQPGGASVAIRKLVEQAMLSDGPKRAQEATYRFITTMAGNEPGYEEALRALFRGDKGRFYELMEPWPADVREHARKLSEGI